MYSNMELLLMAKHCIVSKYKNKMYEMVIKLINIVLEIILVKDVRLILQHLEFFQIKVP
jgi:hypothetical protein